MRLDEVFRQGDDDRSIGSTSAARTASTYRHRGWRHTCGAIRILPTESVKHTITDVLSILGNKALRQPGRSEERRLQIEQVIRHRVNFLQMAQRALGDPWADLHDMERQEFVKIFVELIRDTMANKIDQYHDDQILYLDEQREGSFACVRTNLIGSKVDTSVDFRLERHSGDWLVYDLIIDGASIVRNYRTQFSRIIRDSAYAGLVEKMKQRALTVKWFEKTAPASRG